MTKIHSRCQVRVGRTQDLSTLLCKWVNKNPSDLIFLFQRAFVNREKTLRQGNYFSVLISYFLSISAISTVLATTRSQGQHCNSNTTSLQQCFVVIDIICTWHITYSNKITHHCSSNIEHLYILTYLIPRQNICNKVVSPLTLTFYFSLQTPSNLLLHYQDYFAQVRDRGVIFSSLPQQ